MRFNYDVSSIFPLSSIVSGNFNDQNNYYGTGGAGGVAGGGSGYLPGGGSGGGGVGGGGVPPAGTPGARVGYPQRPGAGQQNPQDQSQIGVYPCVWGEEGVSGGK